MSGDERNDSAQAVAGLRRLLEDAILQLDALQSYGGAKVAKADQVQVDVGGYQIFQGDTAGHLIAELYVEVDPADPRNANLRIEHWGLYPADGWVTPSETNPRPPALAFMRVGMWDTAASFRSALRTKANVTYIQARCETMAP